jgi:hypothetical protein
MGIGILAAGWTRRLQLPRRSEDLRSKPNARLRSSGAKLACPFPGLGKRSRSG